jgi:hypothetical protein
LSSSYWQKVNTSSESKQDMSYWERNQCDIYNHHTMGSNTVNPTLLA